MHDATTEPNFTPILTFTMALRKHTRANLEHLPFVHFQTH